MLAYLNFEGRPPTDNDRSHMGLLVAVSGLRLRGMSVDILAQIGVVVLVTLTSKNAILIVEFAKQAQDGGLLSAMPPLMLRGPGYGRFS